MDEFLTVLIFLIVSLMIIRKDCQLLSKWDLGLYQELLKIPGKTALLLIAAFIAMIFLLQDPIPGVVLGFVLIVLPFYLYRRHEFIKQFNQKKISVAGNEVLISDAIAVILYWLLGVGIISVFIDFIFSFVFLEEQVLWNTLAGTALSLMWMIFLVSLASRKFSEGSFWEDLSFIRPSKGMAKIVAASVALGLFFGSLSSYIIINRHVHPDTPLSKMLAANDSASAIVLLILLALMFAPLAEELIFRGYFFHVLEKVKGLKAAIIVIGLTFAMLHVNQYWGDWLAIGMIALLGMTLTLLRAWSKTTIASTIMHYVYNSTVTIIPMIVLVSSNPAYFEYTAKFPSLDNKGKEELLLESVSRQPNFSAPYHELAKLYFAQDQKLNEALILIDQGLSVEPNSLELQNTRADILYKLKDYQESLNVSNQILSQNVDEELKIAQMNRIKLIDEQLKLK